MKGSWAKGQGPSDWGSHPEQQLNQKEFMIVLKSCLDELPDRFSQVFIMKEMDEYQTDEICKELDISSSNLWVMLHRARAQLRKCIEKNWFENQLAETGVK
jgi:RNA polymerase sigma-70 factor (ECF subfamily)